MAKSDEDNRPQGSSSPSSRATPADDDRDQRGRFRQGWRGGPGRPRGSTSLTAELKRLGDSQSIAQALLDMISDPKTNARERLGAIIEYGNRTEGRSIARSVSMRLGASQLLPPGFMALPSEARMQVLRDLRQRAIEGTLPVLDVGGADHDEA